MNIKNKTRNDLTNSDLRYKRVNFDVFAGYNGLPPFLSNVAHIIFHSIIKTLKYGKGGEAKSKNECRRIYSDIDITIEDILEDFYSVKYANGKGSANDRANMVKKINELLDYNVFYCWRYRDHYMFVLEREIGIWKFYNKDGCVIPRTLKKISVLSKDMINCMERFEKKKNVRVNRKDIEESFMKFINEKIIGNMNPVVVSKLPLWDGSSDIYSYFRGLIKVLRGLDDFEGLGEDDGFLRFLPKSVSKTLDRKRIKEANDMKTKMEKDLIPDETNLVKVKKEKKGRKTKKKVKSKGDSKPKAYTYGGDVNPFKNSKEFVKYYRSILYYFDSKVKFENFAVDVQVAGKIMDSLGEKDRKNKTFLKAWIRYYKDHKLKGLKIYNTKHTSLKSFMGSFDKFNAFFHVSG